MSLEQSTEQIRDIINVDEIKAWLQKRGEGKHPEYRKFLQRNVYNWLVRESADVEVVMPASVQHLVHVMRAMFHGFNFKGEPKLNVKYVRMSESPQWLQDKLNDGAFLLSVKLTPEFADELDHWWDYVEDELIEDETCPDMSRIAIPDMRKSIADWEKRLAKRKVLEGDLQATVWKNDTHVLVRLDNRESYELESQRMHNCVRTYWKKRGRGVTIYSFRDLENEPIYTIEVHHFQYKDRKMAILAQVKGRYPADPTRVRKNFDNRPLSAKETSELLKILTVPNIFGQSVTFVPSVSVLSYSLRRAYKQKFNQYDEDEDAGDYEDDEEDDEGDEDDEPDDNEGYAEDEEGFCVDNRCDDDWV